MQDLYAERMQLFDRLMDELQALRSSGSQYAENEAEYRKALRIAILERSRNASDGDKRPLPRP